MAIISSQWRAIVNKRIEHTIERTDEWKVRMCVNGAHLFWGDLQKRGRQEDVLHKGLLRAKVILALLGVALQVLLESALALSDVLAFDQLWKGRDFDVSAFTGAISIRTLSKALNLNAYCSAIAMSSLPRRLWSFFRKI